MITVSKPIKLKNILIDESMFFIQKLVYSGA